MTCTGCSGSRWTWMVDMTMTGRGTMKQASVIGPSAAIINSIYNGIHKVGSPVTIIAQY